MPLPMEYLDWMMKTGIPSKNYTFAAVYQASAGTWQMESEDTNLIGKIIRYL